MHINVCVDFIGQVLILGQRLLQFIRKHRLIYKLFIFGSQGVVFSFNIITQFHGPEVSGNGFGYP